MDGWKNIWFSDPGKSLPLQQNQKKFSHTSYFMKNLVETLKGKPNFLDNTVFFLC